MYSRGCLQRICRRMRSANDSLPCAPGADAEIVAEAPVVQVVPRLPSGLRECRGFVVSVAGCRQARFDGLLHVGGHVVVRHLGRMAVEQRVRLDGQVIGGNMRGRKRDRRLDVGQGLVRRSGPARHTSGRD